MPVELMPFLGNTNQILGQLCGKTSTCKGG